MTQASRPQASHITNFPFPSDPGPYSADQWAQYMQIVYTGDQQATQGPLILYLNELAVTDNGTTAVYVATGAGIVNGHVLISSEQETWAIPAGPAGGRQDRMVMVENNINVEVTQSTAGRPLLFPNDLSEYTATPGVPPYSARLAILRGDDLNNLPALDQTTALYMVELARYSVNNVPTISAQVDYRDFCQFSTEVIAAMIADRTRRFFVDALAGVDTTLAAQIPLYAGSVLTFSPYLTLPDNSDCFAYGHFAIPSDYNSGMTAEAVLTANASGNVYCDNSFKASACGERIGAGTHSGNTGFSAVAITSGAPDPFLYCIKALSIAGVDSGDIVMLIFERDATNVLDTLSGNVSFAGWLIEYTADS